MVVVPAVAAFSSFSLCTSSFSSLHFPSSLGLSFVRGSLMKKAGRGSRREPPAVACSMMSLDMMTYQ